MEDYSVDKILAIIEANMEGLPEAERQASLARGHAVVEERKRQWRKEHPLRRLLDECPSRYRLRGVCTSRRARR